MDINDDNNKEPRISRLRELIEQLETPKNGRASASIFRTGDEGHALGTPSESTKAFTAKRSPIGSCNEVRLQGAGDKFQNRCDIKFSAAIDDDFIEADEAEEDAYSKKTKKTYSRRGKRAAAKQQEPEERFTTVDKVYDYALNLLTFRDYSKAEMLDKLMKKGASEEFSRAAIAKLLEYNFLNEERYALRVYEMWLNKRVYGRQHLQAELRKRSVEPACMAIVLEQFTSAIESERAEAAAELFMQQNRKKLQELKRMQQSDDCSEDADASAEEDSYNSLRSGRKVALKSSRWGTRPAKLSKAAERMAALKKVQAAAGRFMAARGFSAGYMHILLSRLHQDTDI